jgi:WD40 repeat protein
MAAATADAEDAAFAPSRVLHGHSAWLNALACAGDGSALYSAAEDRRICVFVPDADRQLAAWGASLVPPAALGASMGAARAAALLSDDAPCVHLAGVLSGHARGVLCLALSRDGAALFSGSDDEDVRAWAVGSAAPAERAEGAPPGVCASVLRGHDGPVRALALTHDAVALFSAGGGDCALRRWDARAAARPSGGGEARSVAPVATLRGHTSPVTALAFARAGALLLSASRDGTARGWDVATNACSALFAPWDASEPSASPRGAPPPLESLSVCADDACFLAGGEGGRVSLWAAPPPGGAAADAPPCVTPAAVLRTNATVLCVLASPLAPLAFAGAEDGGVHAWHTSPPPSGADATSRVAWCAPEAHASCVRALALSRDATTLFSGAFDAVVRAWRASDGAPLRTLAAHAWQVRALALSPAGGTLYSAAADDTIRVRLRRCVA